MAQTNTQTKIGEKIDIIFSFTHLFDPDGETKWKLKISVSGMNDIEAILPDVSYDLKAQTERLLKVWDIVPILETEVNLDPIRKELLLTVARILWTVLEV